MRANPVFCCAVCQTLTTNDAHAISIARIHLLYLFTKFLLNNFLVLRSLLIEAASLYRFIVL